MQKVEQERDFVIRPGKAKPQHDRYGRAPKKYGNFPVPLRAVLRKADQISRRNQKAAHKAARLARGIVTPAPTCIVRAVSASSSLGRSHWRARANYIAINKTEKETPWPVFDHAGAVSDPRRIAGLWHDAGDARIYPMVLSPADARGLDFKAFTRDVMNGLNEHLSGSEFKAAGSGVPHGAKIEWMAAAHYDTAHPHVHVVLRGTASGKGFDLTTPVELELRRLAAEVIERQRERKLERPGVERKPKQKAMA